MLSVDGSVDLDRYYSRAFPVWDSTMNRLEKKKIDTKKIRVRERKRNTSECLTFDRWEQYEVYRMGVKNSDASGGPRQ